MTTTTPPDARNALAELLPCPFCGERVDLVQTEKDDNDRAPRPHRVYVIECPGCEVSMEDMSTDWWSSSQTPPESDDDRKAKARVVESWNCRTDKARIAALEAQVEGMRVAEWQPIETAPKDGTQILIAHASNGAVFSAWWEVDGAITDSNHPAWVDGGTNRYEEFTTYEPSHWQPLPAPPARAALQSSETTGEK